MCLTDHLLGCQAHLRKDPASGHDVTEIPVEDADRAVREAVQQVLQHPLRRADGLIGPSLLGDVDRQADRPDDDPVSIGQRLDVRQVRPRSPIVLEDGGLAGQRSRVGLRHEAAGLRSKHHGQRQRGRAWRDISGRDRAYSAVPGDKCRTAPVRPRGTSRQAHRETAAPGLRRLSRNLRWCLGSRRSLPLELGRPPGLPCRRD